MSRIHVERSALKGFQSSTKPHQESYEQAHRSLAAARVDSDAFGRIPYISDQLRNAYDEHVRVCEDGVKAAAEAMADIAGGIEVTLRNYDAVEEQIKEALDTVAKLLNEGPA